MYNFSVQVNHSDSVRTSLKNMAALLLQDITEAE